MKKRKVKVENDSYLKIFEQRGNTIAIWACSSFDHRKIRAVKKSIFNYHKCINKDQYTYNQLIAYREPVHGITPHTHPDINYRTKEGYQRYLNSPHWRKFRKGILAVNKQCRICGATSYLNVHHLSYDTLFYECYEDVVVLCEDHHKDFHDFLDGYGLGKYDKEYRAMIDKRNETIAGKFAGSGI